MKNKQKKKNLKLWALIIVIIVVVTIISFSADYLTKLFENKVEKESLIAQNNENININIQTQTKPVDISKKPEDKEEPKGKIEDKQNQDIDKNIVIIVDNPKSYEVLINRTNSLPSTYAPEDLVKLSEVKTVLENPEINQLRKDAYDALKKLFTAARSQGYELYARSGYRSYNTQNSLYSSYVKTNGQEAADKFSAKPGQSEHQTGLAIDITSKAVNLLLSVDFASTAEGEWVEKNAHEFGFIIRYPKGKEDITGYQYEPWHLRYVGKALAKEIRDLNLTLEEYYKQYKN